jgi:hypothetical protein
MSGENCSATHMAIVPRDRMGRGVAAHSIPRLLKAPREATPASLPHPGSPACGLRGDQLVRASGDDRAALDRFAGGGFPLFPKACHDGDPVVVARDRKGLLVALAVE